MKLIKTMLREWKVSLLVFALLFAQAACELALPGYTSRLVDVGVQQAGIERPSPERLSEDSYNTLLLFMTPEQQPLFVAAYQKEDGAYRLVTTDESELGKLDSLLIMPEALMLMMSSEEGQPLRAMLPLLQSGLMSAEDMQARTREFLAGQSAVNENMLEQAAKQFVRQEYERLGIGVENIQNRYLWRTGGIMLGITLLMGIAAAAVSFLSARAAARISRSMRESLFSRVLSFSSAEVDKFSPASLITRTTNDVQQVENAVAMLMRMVFYAPILGIGGIIRVSATDTGMGWIVFVAVGVMLVLIGMVAILVIPRFRIMQKLMDKLNLVSREVLTGLSVIRAFTREKFERERYGDANNDITRNSLFIMRVFSTLMPTMMLVMNGISILIVWFGAQGINTGNLQVGEMMAFISYTMQIVMSFMMLSMTAVMLPRANVAAERIEEVMNTYPSITDPGTPVALPQNTKGVLVFSNVSFRYPDADEDTIKDISFTVSPGETVAFLGGTGSGKSSIMNLIPRFFDVTDGQITLDGVDIRDYTLKDLRTQIGFVPQRGMLFGGTIASNIKFADPDMPDNRMEEAARIAQAEEFILQKENTYQSEISQAGSNVSGGQKQRLAIARAVAGQPKILLFDDSFSALDFITDSKLRHALRKERGDAAVIIVAQRVSTVLHADCIVMLDGGRIIGMGTHEELMGSCDVYREIAESQLRAQDLKGGLKA